METFDDPVPDSIYEIIALEMVDAGYTDDEINEVMNAVMEAWPRLQPSQWLN